MTNATEELRRLLNERGVEYRIECKQTRATFEPFNRFIVLNEQGGLQGTIDVYLGGACNCTWQFNDLTPEQAIAATLGGGKCEWQLEHSGTLYDKWRCSECGGITETGCPNFCPSCGARVVG